jgi:hypothetical protein
VHFSILLALTHRERLFAMARQQSRGSWISSVFGFATGNTQSERRAPRRKLHAEWLENRMVLSTASLADLGGPSLADYLAQEHQMGPVAPGQIAAADVGAMVAGASMASQNNVVLLAGTEGEGEECTDPNDPTTCDTTDPGTGDDGTGDDGTGGETCTDPNDPTTCGDPGTGETGGETCTDPNDPTTCTDPGTGGTGGTGGETCTDPNDPTTCGDPGTGGDDSVGDPSVDDATVSISDSGNVVVNGSLTDDGGPSNVTMTLDNGTGTIQINDDGTFTINLTDPDGSSTFSVTLTDADGNTCSYTFSVG